MPTVAVTGSSGYLGRKTLERLSKEPDVSRVVGIDVAEPGFSTRNLEFYRLDVRSPDLEHAIRGCDVLVHMAFLQSGREADEMRDVNVGGTRRVFEAAARADIRKIVYVSDALAYGAHPDNDFPLTEDSPLRPNADLPYADHKRETEDIAKAFALAHGDLVVTVLRPCQVLGPDVSGPSARLVQTPVGLMVKGYDPPVQVLHEDDLAEALMLTLAQDLRGVFNVAPDDSLELSAVLSALGRRKLLLGRDRAVRRSEQLWRMRLS